VDGAHFQGVTQIENPLHQESHDLLLVSVCVTLS